MFKHDFYLQTIKHLHMSNEYLMAKLLSFRLSSPKNEIYWLILSVSKSVVFYFTHPENCTPSLQIFETSVN